MKILIIAATKAEYLPVLEATKNVNRNVLFFETGVGILATAVALMKIISKEKPDLIIQMGIAGSFNSATAPLGKIVFVKNETIGDLGVTEKGQWSDIFDLNLMKKSKPPFVNKLLPNPFVKQYNLLKLPVVHAVTVNQITTNKKHIEQLILKYNPVIESMEGASLHYVCTDANIAFLQIRAISNYVGERNKAKWQIKEAIENLNKCVILLLEKIK